MWHGGEFPTPAHFNFAPRIFCSSGWPGGRSHLSNLAEQAIDGRVSLWHRSPDYAALSLDFFGSVQASPGRVVVARRFDGQGRSAVSQSKRILSWNWISLPLASQKSIAPAAVTLAVRFVYLTASAPRVEASSPPTGFPWRKWQFAPTAPKHRPRPRPKRLRVAERAPRAPHSSYPSAMTTISISSWSQARAIR